MTNTTQILCVATVDLDDPRNANAKPRLDDEFIVTHFVEVPALLSTIEGTLMLLDYIIHYLSLFRDVLTIIRRTNTNFEFRTFLLVLVSDFNAKGYLVDAGVYYFAMALTLKM